MTDNMVGKPVRDTPDHLMTVTEWNPGPVAAEPRTVRRGREALVCVHQGMTIAHCPREPCTNAEVITDDEVRTGDPLTLLYRRRAHVELPATFHCSNCLNVAPLEWPADYDEIAAELARRPVPQTRNWYPEGHPQAIAWGVPDGQSVADLRTEAREQGVS